MLSGDRPRTHPDEDRLGYAPFARHLAQSLSNVSLAEGFVAAIYGPWGAGKSTAINFIVHYLQERPEHEQPIVVYFNPWWFSGQEDLTRRFFAQISATVSKRPGVGSKLIKALTDFADVVSQLPPVINLLATVVPWAPAVKTALTALTPGRKDVHELRQRIEKELQKLKRPIIVFIDDIDRLTAEEIRQVFRLIKAVGNFPNIAYVLAFDARVTTKALEPVHGAPGHEYLEKIVQVPFELPLPDKLALRKLLFEELDRHLTDTPDGLFDATHWANTYMDGIDGFIETPRDITRLVNTLSVTYPAVVGEVNPVDFIGIEALRVFHPKVYDVIRKNVEHFAGGTSWGASYADERRKAENAFHKIWLAEVEDREREQVKDLVKRLFPKTQSSWGSTLCGAVSVAEWRKSLRVSSPDVFPVYFRLSVPQGSISNAEMGAILSMLADRDAFEALLLQMAQERRPDGSTRARALLSRLRDYAESDISAETIPAVLNALLSVGDDLTRADPGRSGLFDLGADEDVSRIVRQLLQRYQEPQRFELIRDAVSQGRALHQIVNEVVRYERDYGGGAAGETSPQDDQTVTPEHLNELQRLAATKIREAAEIGRLLATPWLLRVLSAWAEWAGDDNAKVWVQQQIESDEGLLSLLGVLLRQDRSQTVGDAALRCHYRLDPQRLEPYVDTAEIADRLRAMLHRTKLTGREEVAAKQFLREYDFRASGGDPNHPSARFDE